MRESSNLLVAAVTLIAVASSMRPAVAATPEITDPRVIQYAYDEAADAGRFDEALRYAVAGCDRMQLLYLCREVADLPLQIARQGIVVPPQYGVELRRVASAVCLSGKGSVRSNGVDTTGFVCGYYAQQYARAHSPIHRNTFLTRAWQYLDSIHDPQFAGKLYQAACKYGNADACKRVVAQTEDAPAKRP
jgi:hypothetical protein